MKTVYESQPDSVVSEKTDVWQLLYNSKFVCLSLYGKIFFLLLPYRSYNFYPVLYFCVMRL
jgi:hypothetical protein